MKIPFLNPDIREEDIRKMVTSVRSGWLVYGPYAKQMEKDLAKHLKAPYALLTSSCTAALHEAVILAGVGPGDEVVTTALSWVSSSDIVIYEGATPVFADVDRDTGLIDIHEVEKKITPRTKAIIVVHIYGQMVDMKAFEALGKKHNVAVIEDAAHALESSREGVRPGQLGFAACLSFHSAKNITSGQGGALVLHTAEEEHRARLIRRNGVMGRDQNRRKYELGYKYDGTDFQAALLVGQLKRIKSTHKQREKVFARYEKAFSGHAKIRTLKRVPNSVHACHMFPIFVDPEKRDAVREKLRAAGVETSIHWEAIHLEPFYRNKYGFTEGMFPVAEEMGASEITLPTYNKLTPRQQDYVIAQVKKAVDAA
jgi:dTDP-4-amino-4,6-dideoxygalactose transaminase